MTIKALFLNCSLKKSPETSNTQGLMDKVIDIMQDEGVDTETIRIADYNVAPGMTPDEGIGDEWPEIFEKVKESDILVIGTPIWLGEKSSIAKRVIERINGGASLTNDKGQYLYYNKVAGSIVTGNEDGAKSASRDIIYGMSHLGFTIPPNVDSYWVGEAGPGPSFLEAEGFKNDFTKQNTRIMAYNLIHFAKMLKEHPIPAEGNVVNS
ncbi:flavodoxin family protein [Bacillus salacetis]|uniref:Flavodoxin family protein n=1 Tax=Bacillus salacetis TaxID=2315464 RepID=A0A3A1R511_9BACI|nr:flavodoxin family protein [Bacillus salacetis]RIW35075.1 flavodoxin family protein [Bacillus salacetis]